jgi:hypothetical protein
LNTRFILIFCAIGFSSANPIKVEKINFRCIGNYLKSNEMLESIVEYEIYSDYQGCNKLDFTWSKEYGNETYENYIFYATDTEHNTYIAGEFEFKNENIAHAECYASSLKEVGFIELLLRKVFYQVIPGLSQKQRTSIEKKVHNDLDKTENRMLSACRPEKFFGELYDQKIESKDLEKNQQGDYCVRKYLVDKKLIDPDAIQMSINPHGIKTDFDCTYDVDEYLEKMKRELLDYVEDVTKQPRHQIRCLGQTIRNHKAADYLAKVNYLSAGANIKEFHEEEKQKFIEFMSKLFKNLLQCRKN